MYPNHKAQYKGHITTIKAHICPNTNSLSHSLKRKISLSLVYLGLYWIMIGRDFERLFFIMKSFVAFSQDFFQLKKKKLWYSM